MWEESDGQLWLLGFFGIAQAVTTGMVSEEARDFQGLLGCPLQKANLKTSAPLKLYLDGLRGCK